MSWEAWFTLAVVVLVIVVLVRDLVPPSAAMVGAMTAVLAGGIVVPSEAFSGFANPAPFTIAALYVLAKAVEKTRALTPLVDTTLGSNSSPRFSLLRLTAPVAVASAFLNNTPIVAMLIPQVERWSMERRRSPSDYLMPLSYAAILGGVMTLMGTSTNIVVSGLLEEAGLEPLGFFEITAVGLPIALAGIVTIVALAPGLLPSRRSPRQEIEEQFREFVVDMTVVPAGPLDGEEVEEAGLRHLPGGFLVEIERDGEVIAPVSPTTVLRGGDRLRFAGRSNQVVDLQERRGLASTEEDELVRLDSDRSTYFEVVIGPGSPLVGRTVREAAFRERYQAAVLAIHRAGRRIDARIGDVPVRIGDTLLVQADPGFKRRWGERGDFLLVSPLAPVPPRRSPRAVWVGLVAAGIVLTAATGSLSLVAAALLGALVLVAGGIVTPGEARDSVDLDVVITIAAAFGLAAAISQSGLADQIGSALVGAFDGLGDIGVLLGVVLATLVLKEIITNKAAVLLIFPIAVATALEIGADVRPFAIAVAVSGAVAFLTPIGFTTNMMIYGPGGYRFTDYLRLGTPLTLVSLVLTLAIVPIVWPL
jgi:di/tricarboxylate transporter